MELNEANDQERQHPWLLISSHGPPHTKQYFYSISENRFYPTSIPELCNKSVLASDYGWLVLVDHNTDDCYLWNPISKDKIVLPQLDNSSVYNRCVLSKPPTDPDCHILFNSFTLEQAFLQIGDDEFVVQLSSPDDRLTTICSFQGNIYALMGYSHYIVTLHFVDKNLELRRMMMEDEQPWCFPILTHPIWTQWQQKYLIGSPCGELLIVQELFSCYLNYDGLDFKVFRLDVNQLKHVELDNIGNRSIFLDHLSERGVDGGTCYYSNGIKPNCIYYTTPNSRNLYVYDLNNRSTTLSLPCPAARRSQSKKYWVEHEIFQIFE